VTLDLLEQRLADLTVSAPDAGRITSRVLSLAATPRRRPIGRLAALAVATLALMLGVLYFVPRADAVLADTPVAGNLLRDAGLAGAGDRVTAVGAVSTSSGYRLELVGAYADATRTVLIVHAQPSIYLGGTDPELKDQFGRSYMLRGAMADARTGELVMEFEALAWPDAITGARIALHWTAVQPVTCITPAGDPGHPVCNTGQPVAGSWTLPAIIGVDEGTVLTLPAPGRLGSANFRFTSVVSTPATIEADIEVTGISFKDLNKRIPDGLKGRPAFTVELIGPDGLTNGSGGGGGNSSDDLTGTHIQIQLRWVREKSVAGDYRLRVAYEGLGEFDRVLHIP
jgi:hypothetical protein